jgi:hypothetical protein
MLSLAAVVAPLWERQNLEWHKVKRTCRAVPWALCDPAVGVKDGQPACAWCN